jgi:tetrahydromethanopterin S-methyltransferase subunit B
MSISIAEVKLIDKIVDVLQDQISKLEERVKELERREPTIINNHYHTSYPPVPSWPYRPDIIWGVATKNGT